MTPKSSALGMALQVREKLDDIGCRGRYRAVGDPDLPAAFSEVVGIARELRSTADALVEALQEQANRGLQPCKKCGMLYGWIGDYYHGHLHSEDLDKVFPLLPPWKQGE